MFVQWLQALARMGKTGAVRSVEGGADEATWCDTRMGQGQPSITKCGVAWLLC